MNKLIPESGHSFASSKACVGGWLCLLIFRDDLVDREGVTVDPDTKTQRCSVVPKSNSILQCCPQGLSLKFP